MSIVWQTRVRIEKSISDIPYQIQLDAPTLSSLQIKTIQNKYKRNLSGYLLGEVKALTAFKWSSGSSFLEYKIY